MKCDEEKPSCLKCRSTGRTCDGYLTQEIYKGNAFQKLQLKSTGIITIGRNPYVGIIGNDQERRGFKFFQFRTAQELATALNLTSWDYFMLQASHSNPAVLHAAIALGTLGERFQINSVLTTENAQANDRHEFACRQYYKAVAQVREQLCNNQEHSVDFILMSCILFTCFEFMQGNDAGALMHLRNGMEILRREQGGSSTDGLTVLPPAGLPKEPGLMMEDITYVFAVLDVQATIWLGLESFQSPAWSLVRLPDTPPPPLIPERFPSLEEVKQSLYDQIATVYRFQRSAAAYLVSRSTDHAPRTALTERQERLTQLSEWLLASEAFVQLGHDFSSDDLHGITVMNINHKTTFILLTVSFQPNEDTIYRSFHADFAEIVSLAETLLHPVSSNASRPLSTQEPLLIFEFRALLIKPLYFTAIKCRHLRTCRQAISLLSASPWREGAWDSAAMARIAERKVRQWEEEGVRYRSHDALYLSGASSSLFTGEGDIEGMGATVSGGPAPFLPLCGNSVRADQIVPSRITTYELSTVGVGSE